MSAPFNLSPWEKTGKAQALSSWIFVWAGFHGVSPAMSDVVLSWPERPISTCLGNTSVLSICRADGLVYGLCHSPVVTDSSRWRISEVALSYSSGRGAESMVPKDFNLRVQSEGAPQGQIYWKWLAWRHPASIVEQSVLCSVRVMNFLAECKLWGYYPSRTIHRIMKYFPMRY